MSIVYITLQYNISNEMNVEGVDMHYTQRIRDLREDLDLRQKDVAELLNVGQKTYSDYELGKSRIPVDSIIILAKFYNVSLDYICGVSNDKHQFPVKWGAVWN